MHPQPSCRFGNIAAAIREDSVQVFPFHSIQRRNILRRIRRRTEFQQSPGANFGIGWFCQVINRPGSHCFNRVRDGAVSRQNDNSRALVERSERFDEIQSAATGHPHIDQRIFEYFLPGQFERGRRRGSHGYSKAAALEGCSQSFPKNVVVVDDKKRRQFRRIHLLFSGKRMITRVPRTTPA